jgi:hypothetical protein
MFEREERVFTAAFGIMDSTQEGEAVIAFLRVRDILHRRGGGFRRLLERCEAAERFNADLGQQNAELLRENAALRARDSRPVGAALGDSQRWDFSHWDLGIMVIIAVLAVCGQLGTAVALALAAAVLICAAFTHWFSPFRFLAGALLTFAAYAAATSAHAAPASAAAESRPDCNCDLLRHGFDRARGHDGEGFSFRISNHH